jgi:dTDP-4-dehydrorhamnose reductase
MKILLTGMNGQVGWELRRTLAVLGEVIAMGRRDMDLASPDSLRRAVRKTEPALIVNAAAYTAVEKAESEPELAMAINGVAPGILAEEAKRFGAAIVHYSTDYVFDGSKDSPYVEADPPNPLNVYGKTKLEGERAIRAVGAPYLIFRTSWVYGARGKNFLLTILRLAKERDELRIVDDQIGAPTWSRVIAEITAQVISQCYLSPRSGSQCISERGGLYHLTAGGQTSWHDFAKAIIEDFSNLKPATSDTAALPRTTKLTPIISDQYPGLVKRPRNSLLANTKLAQNFGVLSPSWRQQLDLCMQELAL